jgi:Tfp pilus assembly pilus retraction ATPase PilT
MLKPQSGSNGTPAVSSSDTPRGNTQRTQDSTLPDQSYADTFAEIERLRRAPVVSTTPDDAGVQPTSQASSNADENDQTTPNKSSSVDVLDERDEHAVPDIGSARDADAIDVTDTVHTSESEHASGNTGALPITDSGETVVVPATDPSNTPRALSRASDIDQPLESATYPDTIALTPTENVMDERSGHARPEIRKGAVSLASAKAAGPTVPRTRLDKQPLAIPTVQPTSVATAGVAHYDDAEFFPVQKSALSTAAPNLDHVTAADAVVVKQKEVVSTSGDAAPVPDFVSAPAALAPAEQQTGSAVETQPESEPVVHEDVSETLPMSDAGQRFHPERVEPKLAIVPVEVHMDVHEPELDPDRHVPSQLVTMPAVEASTHSAAAAHVASVPAAPATLAASTFADLYLESGGRAWTKRVPHDSAARELDGARLADACALRELLEVSDTETDIRLRWQDVLLRVRRIPTLAGHVFICRRLPDAPRPFSSLGFSSRLTTALLSRSLKDGGIVLFTGSAGAGKSTSLGSWLAAWLQRHGGVAYTVENPAELATEGVYYGNNGVVGTCYQTEVRHDAQFGERSEELLRASPDLIALGEIRHFTAAGVAALAGASGNIIAATLHAGNLSAGLERFRTMIEAAGQDTALLAESLAAIVHQAMHVKEVDGTLEQTVEVSPLVIAGSTHEQQIRGMLRSGNLGGLSSELHRQQRYFDHLTTEGGY